MYVGLLLLLVPRIVHPYKVFPNLVNDFSSKYVLDQNYVASVVVVLYTGVGAGFVAGLGAGFGAGAGTYSIIPP